MTIEKITEETHKELCESWKKQARDVKLTELHDFIGNLVNGYDHDYGTICHAMTACGLAALSAADKEPGAGITGFQASWIMLDLVKEWMRMKGPFRLVDYADLLYPQNAYRFKKVISQDTWKWIQDEPRKKWDEEKTTDFHAHPDVVAHWLSIQAGKVPFGFEVVE